MMLPLLSIKILSFNEVLHPAKHYTDHKYYLHTCITYKAWDISFFYMKLVRIWNVQTLQSLAQNISTVWYHTNLLSLTYWDLIQYEEKVREHKRLHLKPAGYASVFVRTFLWIIPHGHILQASYWDQGTILAVCVAYWGMWVTRGSTECSSPVHSSGALALYFFLSGMSWTVHPTLILGWSSLYQTAFPATVSWNPESWSQYKSFLP